MEKLKIKNIECKIVKVTFGDDSQKYMIAVEYETPGYFWGWNKQQFVMMKEPDLHKILNSDSGYLNFVNNSFGQFDNLCSIQKIQSDLGMDNNTEFLMLDNIDDVNNIIKKFKKYIEIENRNNLSNIIKKIEIV